MVNTDRGKVAKLSEEHKSVYLGNKHKSDNADYKYSKTETDIEGAPIIRDEDS